jgi:formamidopyrimidine-DNA glycosylase
MPELPEVETMCRGITPIVGQRVLKIERPPCRRRPIEIEPRLDRFRRRAQGKTISRVERAGKRVVIWLSDKPRDAKQNRGEEAIILEPRMTGLVLLSDPPTREHLRFRLRLSGPNRGLLFWDRRGLGSIRLLSAAEFAARLGSESRSLGPDALAISPQQLRERLHASRRAIKVALLDQRAVAGIGNLYASEILHAAGIHPAARCHRLIPQQWDRLHTAMRVILNSAIEHEGSTLSDGTYRNALNQSGGYQNHHRVYDRAGKPCPTCGQPIQRIVQAQRSTFLCPNCQRR